MANIEIIKEPKLGTLNVVIDGKNFGVFEVIDIDSDQYRYFSRREDQITGDHLIAIGEALNQLNNKK